MARDEAKPDLPGILARPQIRLFGEVNDAMLDKFLCQLGEAEGQDGDIALELTTPGGDAEIGRRIVLEIEDAQARLDRRFVFLGKTIVYSAGATIMSAFPKRDRYLRSDAVVMIHCRQLDEQIEISGPMRASLPKLEAIKLQIETGIELEQRNFERLIDGSEITLAELWEKALHNWYLTACEALDRGLVMAVVEAEALAALSVGASR